jgi:hypothetical protein
VRPKRLVDAVKLVKGDAGGKVHVTILVLNVA